ncbi:GNVR domain-containing protein [Hoeflea sp.]|uniref:GNVR domain-containing protein n=1 Tax=Hoeflea sp. TaxID=1940281 RepID=UPI003A92427F
MASASSLLATPTRSARISTSRYAPPASHAPARPAESLLASAPATPAAPAAATPSPPDADRAASSGREKFGDRIARLIGTIAPESKPAAPVAAEREPAPDRPEPATTAPEPQPRARPESPSQRAEQAQQPSFPHDRPRDEPYNGDDHYHWHAASAGGQYEDGNRPLLDASILISAVWRFRRLIGAATVAGAVLGVLMALSTPHRYYAESRLFVDPREIRVTEDDIRNQQLSTEAMLAITDSQLQILSSTSVLEKVVEDLNLDRDPEFNGSMSSGGISGGVALIKELFTGKNPASEGEQKALNNLRDALSVGRDAKTFVIIVGVDTRDPEKSALIANQIVETYLDSEGQAQSSLLERTSESIDTRIKSLRSDLDAAEREVERFKAENGLVGVGGQYIDDKEILALSDQLANARAMKVGIRVKADNLAKVKIDDVLSGAFPEELLSSNLSELRKQYAQTKSNADSLATRLGPRHPQYIAAKQSLQTITNEISAELRRIVASSQTELQRAVETEQELASQMAVAKSRAIDQSVELVNLRELERKANATRGIYEAFLTRSRETSERSNLSTRNVRVISPAEAPLQPMGPSRKFIALGGMIAGFIAGLGLALLVGAVESIRAYNGGMLPQTRFPGSPSGGYPQPPAPGTPPGGPGHRFWPRRNDARDAANTTAGQPAAEPFSGARAHFAQEPGDQDPASHGPVRVEPVVAKSAQAEPGRMDNGFGDRSPAQSGPVTHSIHQAPGTGRNAQAFMSAHGQPHHAGPALPPQQPMATMQDPRMAGPQWPAYPAAPQPYMQPHAQAYPHPQQPPLPSYPQHPGYAAGPYAPVHPAHNTAYSVAQQPYPVPPSPMMPASQPQFYPQSAQMPQQPYAAAYPAQPAYPPQPQFAPAPVPAQAWPQPVQQAPAMPDAQAHQPADPARPVRNDKAVDRIRKEMDQLRSRIDGYGSDRRSA